jgi:hypothetical protein
LTPFFCHWKVNGPFCATRLAGTLKVSSWSSSPTRWPRISDVPFTFLHHGTDRPKSIVALDRAKPINARKVGSLQPGQTASDRGFIGEV